jgi:hypothetical protein
MHKRIGRSVLVALLATVPITAVSGPAHAAADSASHETATTLHQRTATAPQWYFEGNYLTQTECVVSAALYQLNDPAYVDSACRFNAGSWELWLYLDI